MKQETKESVAISGDAYRTLLLVALLGVDIGEKRLGEEIVEALIELRPDLPHAQVSHAIAKVRAGATEDGVSHLERTLSQFPDNQMCKAMLGVFMRSLGRPGWQALLEEVIEDGRDECAIEFACTALGRKNEATAVLPQAEGTYALWA